MKLRHASEASEYRDPCRQVNAQVQSSSEGMRSVVEHRAVVNEAGGRYRSSFSCALEAPARKTLSNAIRVPSAHWARTRACSAASATRS